MGVDGEDDQQVGLLSFYQCSRQLNLLCVKKKKKLVNSFWPGPDYTHVQNKHPSLVRRRRSNSKSRPHETTRRLVYKPGL